MDRKGTWQCFSVVLATLVLAIARGVPCDQRIVLKEGQTVQIDVTQLTLTRGDCVMEFSTRAEWRVVLTFSYWPSYSNVSVTENCAYMPDYLLIGNDVTAIGQDLMTSYKFCRQTAGEEMVSRDSHLWLVLRDSQQYRHRHRHHLLTLNATTLPQASCNDTEMECSPVQCVPRSVVCDGHRDCNNGRDEYCYDFTRARNAEDEEYRGDQQLLPPEGSTCFLCRDGTCILPRLPRYDYKWGMWLWYLCDGVPHCPDGWDEQAYMCYLSRHFPQRAQSQLFQCQAFDPPLTVSRQVRMWSLARCDHRRDCRLEGEEGQDRCDSVRGVTASGSSKTLYMNPLALSMVIVFAVFIIIASLLILRHFERAEGRGCREPDNRDHECMSDLRSCLAVKSTLAHTTPFVAKQDFERLRETAV
ncbi:uncharacterized protein LOC143300375 [Babylonia areolata]|uniref:uncharacterized protein LOC143300375 n=1 Tax=Babylonia areolata TaxID=304850 RepID=UPI003FD1B779